MSSVYHPTLDINMDTGSIKAKPRLGPTYKPLCRCPGLYIENGEYCSFPCEKDATEEDGYCEHCREVCTETIAMSLAGVRTARRMDRALSIISGSRSAQEARSDEQAHGTT